MTQGQEKPKQETAESAAEAAATEETIDFGPGEEAAEPETTATDTGAAETAGAETETAGDEAALAAPDLSAEVERLQAEAAELKDQLLRALAETENVRNRARREREDLAKFAAAPLAKDLLGVADNLRRALDAVPADLAQADERVGNLVAGVEMTEKALIDAFAKHHIARIDPQGEKLDPHRHEAMMEVQDPSRPAGTVAQVFEVGYALHERLLRPARVSVATGGPEAKEEPPEPGSTVDTEV